VAEFFGSDPDSGDEVDDRVLHEVDAAMVGEALTRLTERHRRILSLREEAGMTYQAIAEHESVAVSAVETLLWRARQALKREFCALAEAAEGRGAGLVGLGIVGRLLSHVLRLPVRTAKRLAHFTPASAVLTVASISAVGAVAIGVTHAAAPVAIPGTGQGAALATHALGGAPGVSGVMTGWPVATGGAPGVAGAADATDAGAGDGSGTGATFLGGSSVVPGVTALDGSGPGSSLYPAGAGGGGAAVADGASGSGAGLGGLLDALGSGGTSGNGLGAVTQGVSAAAGSVGSTLSSVTGAASNAVGRGSGVTTAASGASGAVGSTLSTVAKAASGAVDTVSGAAGSTAGGAPTTSAASPVLGEGSTSSGGGVAGSVPPLSPASSSGGAPLPPVGIGGLFG
jgi:hypothetical protein